MRLEKMLAGGSLLACLLAAPGLVPSAEARHDRHCDRIDRSYYAPTAWDIVSSDPCLYDQYRRYAKRHKNPNKRARYADRLAREGCRDPRYVGYDSYGYDPYRGGYGGYPPYDPRPRYPVPYGGVPYGSGLVPGAPGLEGMLYPLLGALLGGY